MWINCCDCHRYGWMERNCRFSKHQPLPFHCHRSSRPKIIPTTTMKSIICLKPQKLPRSPLILPLQYGLHRLSTQQLLLRHPSMLECSSLVAKKSDPITMISRTNEAGKSPDRISGRIERWSECLIQWEFPQNRSAYLIKVFWRLLQYRPDEYPLFLPSVELPNADGHRPHVPWHTIVHPPTDRPLSFHPNHHSPQRRSMICLHLHHRTSTPTPTWNPPCNRKRRSQNFSTNFSPSSIKSEMNTDRNSLRINEWSRRKSATWLRMNAMQWKSWIDTSMTIVDLRKIRTNEDTLIFLLPIIDFEHSLLFSFLFSSLFSFGSHSMSVQ